VETSSETSQEEAQEKMKITAKELRKIIREVLEETKYDPIDLDDLLEEEVDEYGRPTDHDKIDEQDQDGDGDEDFADVMISRMTASGMDKQDAIKKTSRKKYNKKPTKKKISENLQYHVDHGVGVEMNVFRPGSEAFFELFAVKKVEWGLRGMSVKIADAGRRKSFAARHRCEKTTKKDKATPRYWACRTGRYPHLTGGKKKYKWW
jgi:hypothetical protein